LIIYKKIVKFIFSKKYMNIPFKNIGLAVTFSPCGEALVKEAARLRDLFNIPLTLIHAGDISGENGLLLKEMMARAGLDDSSVNIACADGQPSKVILKIAKENNIDLLIAGALEKENLIKYYVGSVARTIMREAHCSVLIIPSNMQPVSGYKNFFMPVDYSAESEKKIKMIYDFALLEKASEFVLVREFKAHGLAMTIYDSGSSSETENIRTKWQKEEEGKLSAYVKELALSGVPVTCECMYGDEYTGVVQYIKDRNDALLVIQAPENQNYISRLFPRNAELIFENLPCPLLIIR
jgi:nucleotide-binding universal stress UspA family protein